MASILLSFSFDLHSTVLSYTQMENSLSAIQIFCRASRGHRFASMRAELWYVFHVRVSFNDYTLRFVGDAAHVLDCIACFYRQ